MAVQPQFQHQRYSSEQPASSTTHYLTPSIDTDVESQRTATKLTNQAGVSAILLVHGTFAGTDALGISRELSRFWPEAGKKLLDRRKELFDWLVQDAGNYTEAYAQHLSAACDRSVRIERFNWSSENHHIGRADAAIKLVKRICELDDELPTDSRIQIWAHSHGGNVLALLTNLLGGDERRRRQFFRASRVYYRWPVVGRIDFPVWLDVQKKLETGWSVADRLDLVTFGTPIRYGWEPGGFGRLLHFVHHKPIGDTPHLAALPSSLDDVLNCRGGDYVQHFGIAGTNVVPGFFAWRARWADRRLNRILQSGIRKRDLWQRLKTGARVPDTGETLLVDYGPATGKPTEDIFGHAVYTRDEWLGFHFAEIAKRFYSCPSFL